METIENTRNKSMYIAMIMGGSNLEYKTATLYNRKEARIETKEDIDQYEVAHDLIEAINAMDQIRKCPETANLEVTHDADENLKIKDEEGKTLYELTQNNETITIKAKQGKIGEHTTNKILKSYIINLQKRIKAKATWNYYNAPKFSKE